MLSDFCSGILETLAILNDATNHGCTFTLEELPAEASLDRALATYFASMYTSLTPAQPAAAWQIQTRPLGDDLISILKPKVKQWFFKLEYSPKVDRDNSKRVVDQFLKHLGKLVGETQVFQVEVSPPMFYECAWEDFAFDGNRQRWLLHFGISD